MPRQKRWALKQSVDQAVNDLNRAQDNLAKLYAEFDTVHPELADNLAVFTTAIQMTKEGLTRFKDSF